MSRPTVGKDYRGRPCIHWGDEGDEPFQTAQEARKVLKQWVKDQENMEWVSR